MASRRNPRNRILIFRLSEDEYEQVERASTGARSLSEFVRSKLLEALQSDPVNEQLARLSTRVDQLAGLLERE